MRMHTEPTEVMEWETRFSFVSILMRIPYGSGRGQVVTSIYRTVQNPRENLTHAYHLVLPPHLHKTHNVFHVSVLCHYVVDESHKLNWKELQVSDVGTLTVEPLRILDCRV
jgi:hypothetical protein